MDIVERLRERTDSSVLLLSDPPQRVKDALCQEAADEIERLRNKARWLEMVEKTVVKQDAEIEQLREALRDVIPYIDTCNSEHRDAQERAKAALKEGE